MLVLVLPLALGMCSSPNGGRKGVDASCWAAGDLIIRRGTRWYAWPLSVWDFVSSYERTRGPCAFLDNGRKVAIGKFFHNTLPT